MKKALIVGAALAAAFIGLGAVMPHRTQEEKIKAACASEIDPSRCEFEQTAIAFDRSETDHERQIEADAGNR